jgi:acetyl esterase/lipase
VIQSPRTVGSSIGRARRARYLGMAVGVAVSVLCSACLSNRGVPTEIAPKISSSGRVVDGRGMAALYAPLQEKEPYGGVRISRDESYGPAPQNRADVFLPQHLSGRSRPVLIFVHGGGFTAGARKLGPDSPFYDNVGVWAVHHDLIGITLSYRLAPQSRWPSAAEDIASAVEWVRRTIEVRGGDPKRIFLMGHSAGATHVASYVSHAQFGPNGCHGIRGAIIVSGSFDVTLGDVPADEKSFVEREAAYFIEDPAHQAEQSSIPGLVASPVPLLVVNAEYDPQYFLRRAAALQTTFERSHRADRFVVLSGESHMSEVFSINSEDENLTRELARFIRRHPDALEGACQQRAPPRTATFRVPAESLSRSSPGMPPASIP